MLWFKLFLLSTGVLSTAVMLKLPVPPVRQFAISEGPSIWSLLSSWLRPPYLYLVINCIIIGIFASSKFQQKVDESPPVSVKTSEEARTEFAMAYGVLGSKDSAVEVRSEFGSAKGANVVNALDPEMSGHVNARAPETKTTSSSEHMSDRDEPPLQESFSTSKNTRQYALYTKKPSVSERFGHGKAVKAKPEGHGRTPGVAGPKRHDTPESTWQTITEGRQMPLTRHLRRRTRGGRRDATRKIRPPTPRGRQNRGRSTSTAAAAAAEATTRR